MKIIGLATQSDIQAAGYHTGVIGKWHLGSEPTGFNEWTILPGQGVYHNPTFFDRTGRRDLKGYVTDVITATCSAPRTRTSFRACRDKKQSPF